MVAAPGTKDYGALSILLQATGELALLRTLPPQAFWPAPRVRSAIVQWRLDRTKHRAIADLRTLKQVIDLLLGHRRKKIRTLIAAFAGLAAVAVAGWARRTDAGVAPAAYTGTFTPAPGSTGPCVDQGLNQPPAPGEAPPPEAQPAFADRSGVREVRAQPAMAERAATDQPAPAPAPQRRATRKHRSTARSAAIVAGTAGVGAAIGGIAAGGKGAALGALSGGGAGFVYDRLTVNRR